MRRPRTNVNLLGWMISKTTPALRSRNWFDARKHTDKASSFSRSLTMHLPLLRICNHPRTTTLLRPSFLYRSTLISMTTTNKKKTSRIQIYWKQALFEVSLAITNDTVRQIPCVCVGWRAVRVRDDGCRKSEVIDRISDEHVCYMNTEERERLL